MFREFDFFLSNNRSEHTNLWPDLSNELYEMIKTMPCLSNNSYILLKCLITIRIIHSLMVIRIGFIFRIDQLLFFLFVQLIFIELSSFERD